MEKKQEVKEVNEVEEVKESEARSRARIGSERECDGLRSRFGHLKVAATFMGEKCLSY